MKMKKLLLSLALASCCSFGLGLAACDDNGNESSSSSQEQASSYTVTFTQTEGVSILSQTQSGSTVDKDETISFTLQISSFYEGTPVVTVNNVEITADEDGTYSFAVKDHSTVKISGVQRAVGDLTGAGTSDDAYVINSVQDLLYMAEKINAGDLKYTGACYYLANDLDCEGTALDVIGDGSTPTSFFSGVFNGNDKTISNYTMQTQDTVYVGLFGWVVADTSSAATSAIYNLTLQDFTISATMQENSMFCGSLIGFSIGATVSQCNAYNGSIEINGDPAFTAYTGGLIGLTQATYLQQTQNSYNACVAYCVTDVDVNVQSGSVVAGGGLVGYALSDNANAVSYIVNCYATGDVSGAIRAGGLVGVLGQYTSLSSCYALGNVHAKSTLTDESDGDLRNAYAGGLVGYSENNSIVADCFAIGETTEEDMVEHGTVHSSTQNGQLVGGMDQAGYTTVQAQACVVFNSYYAQGGVDGSVDFTSAVFQTNSLKFPAYDWVIADGSYPTINYSYSEDITFALTLDFGDTLINDAKTYVLELSSHFPLTYLHLSEDVPEYVVASDSVNSYGYFFDEQLTMRVPRCFVTTRDITLYTGFADNTEIAGTYYLQTSDFDIPVTLTLNTDGTFTYYDGGLTSTSAYVYDGKNILLQSARFARYLPVEDGITVNDLINRFAFYDFMASVQDDGSLVIYGGAHNVGTITPIYEYYYSAQSPLLASKTPTAVSNENVFVGEWYSKQAVGYTLIFDNQGNYAYNDELGTYTVEGAQANLSNGKTVAYADGVLTVNGMQFYSKGSYVGAWTSFDSTITLHLNGIDDTGLGRGELVYGESTAYKIFYVAEQSDFLNGYITVYSENQLIGLLQLGENVLVGYFFHPVAQYMTDMAFRLCDAFSGEWIGDSTFESLYFNGLGIYNDSWGDVAEMGSVTVNGESVAYEVADKFYARFTYNGKKYTAALDIQTNTVTVTGGTTLQRKDAYASLTLTDDKGNVYTFDGRGALGELDEPTGTLTITAADGSLSTVQYTVNQDGSLNLSDGEHSGLLRVAQNVYLYEFNGVQTTLRINNFFSNDWAVAQLYATLSIGSFDLDGNVTAKYPKVDAQTGEITYLTVSGKLLDKDTLTLQINDGNGYTLYLFAIADDEIAISTYPSLSYGNYTVAAVKDELFGVWTSKVTQSLSLIFTFDGLVNSSNTTATAVQSQSSAGSATQSYYYSRQANGAILLWSANTIGTQTSYSLVEWCSTTERGAFVNADGTKAFKLVTIDSLYQLSAYMENGDKWLFDGQGGVDVYENDVLVATYTYTINVFNDNSTVDLTVVIDGETVKMRVDYSDVKATIDYLTE